MLIVGLTGGLSTGKSFVADEFSKLGAQIISADTLAHQLILKGGDCFEAVVAAFGSDIVEHGQINRQALARIVFADPLQRNKLEAILHPAVRRALLAEAARYQDQGASEVLVLEVPLLYETGWEQDVDYVVVVSAQQAQQLDRAQRHLGLSRQEALQRLAAQYPMHEKIKNADIVIDNSETQDKTREQVKRVWKKFQQHQKR